MKSKTINQMFSLFMAFVVFVGSVYVAPATIAFAQGDTTRPAETSNHWFSTPVRIGQDVAVIDGYDVVTNNLPSGVYAYALPGKNGSVPSIDSAQLYEPITIEEYITDMADKNIFRYSADDMHSMMANVIFNTSDIRNVESTISELRSYGVGTDVSTHTISSAEEYLDMLISKNTFSASSQLQRTILTALKGMEVPMPTVGIEYDKARMSSPRYHEDGYYYYGPIHVAASGYKSNNDLGFRLTKFSANGTDSGAELVRHGTSDEAIVVNTTKIEHGEELYIKIKDSSYVESVYLEFTHTHYERAVQLYRTENANGMYLASPYWLECNIIAAEGFGKFGTKGTLTIRRYDMKGTPLNGGSYSIKALDSGNSFADVTGVRIVKDGTLVVQNLPMGTYEVWEDSAPSGHNQVMAHQFFEVFADGQMVIKEFRSDKFNVGVKVRLADADTNNLITHGGTASIVNLDTNEVVATGSFAPNGFWECSLPFGDYAVQAGESPDRYFFIGKTNPVQFKISDEKDAPEITLKAKPVQGSVTLHVKEWMGTPAVPNALFYLYNATTGERVTKYNTLVTDASGVIKIPDIEYGQYYLVQQQFPQYSKYMPDTTPLYFNIYGRGYTNDQGQYVTEGTEWVYTHENKLKRGAVEVSVLDESGHTVDGLELSIFRKSDPSNVLHGQFTSSGQVTFYDLDPDTYVVKWTNRLEDYIYEAVSLEAKITEDGDFVQLTMPVIRFKRGTVVATKVDSVTNNPIRDVFFVVVDKDGNEVARVRTGDDGTATASGLKVGTYYIQEVKENEKYAPNKNYTPFVIADHGQTVRLTFKETMKQGRLTIQATDGKGNPIVGVMYSIYDLSNNLIAQGTTDMEGKYYVAGLAFGEYNIFVDTVPEKYQPITIPTKFAIKNMHDEVVEKFVFEQVTGTITIIKRDKITKEPLPFAEFYLYEYDTGKHVGTAVSDANGKAIFSTVPYGRYYVIEVKAPPGYQLNTEVIGGGHDMTEPSEGWPIGYNVNVAALSAVFGMRTVYAANTSGGLWIDENHQNIVVDEGTVTNPSASVPVDPARGKSLTVVMKPYGENSSARSMLIALIDSNTSTIKDFLVVDEDQTVTFEGLNHGKYTLQVVNYPNTWLDRIAAKEFTITDNNITAYFSSSGWTYEGAVPEESEESGSTTSWGERIYGSLDVYVKSDANMPLADVQIGLFAMDGSLLQTHTTNYEGKISVPRLEYGTYYVRQLGTLDGYTADTASHTLKIEEQGKCMEVYITNAQVVYNPTTPSEPSSPTVSTMFEISGGMALDRGDGYFDANDYGMEGYRVTLFDSRGGYVASTYTDMYGRYRFAVPEHSVYSVRFDLPLWYEFLYGSDANLANDRGYVIVDLGTTNVGYANCLLKEVSHNGTVVTPGTEVTPEVQPEVQPESQPESTPNLPSGGVDLESGKEFTWIDVPIVVQTRALGKTGNEARQYYYVGDGANGNPLGLPDTGDRGIPLPMLGGALALATLAGCYVLLEKRRKKYYN